MPVERFIPFRKQDIIQMCSQELNDETSANSFNQFCQLLSSVIHFDYHEQLESLKNTYAPFDPNADTQQIKSFSTAHREQCKTNFAEYFAKTTAPPTTAEAPIKILSIGRIFTSLLGNNISKSAFGTF